ncbi:glutaredoxin domain-containing protein [Sanguibacter antarcticus]|uniref:Glutaredoxin n=1 Tax=Sanguibacter antarcticus TaxID=372484 RepID=A0A2A9E6N3_9MICO|nr:glutaredoxin domain-containing protein [Sanguibacter antarcticus]PFG33840.1 glutaredoxin [Sanguibacter antarcticus]
MTTTIEVMWRPGCPFCSSLRRGLSRAGVATTEHNIWSSADAAARVRAANGGDETVPTVFVGDRALVNPSVSQVLDAVRSVDPDYMPVPTPTAGRAGTVVATNGLATGLVWTLVVAAVWSVLVAWRPTTTWHLVPLMLAAAWPWAVGQAASARDPSDRASSARRHIVLAGTGGLVSAAALSWLLSAVGRLEGPIWAGAGSPLTEALVLAAVGAAVATVVGLARTVRD